MKKSNYNFFFDHGILVLQDLGGGTSLTNNMENILKDLSETLEVDLRKKKIIYRDSLGSYDGVYWDGKLVKFIPIGKRSLTKALEVAREYQ